MAYVYKADPENLIIFRNNGVPDLTNSKITVSVMDGDQQVPCAITSLVPVGCTATYPQGGTVATITGVSANSGSLQINIIASGQSSYVVVDFDVLSGNIIAKAQKTISRLEDGYTIRMAPPAAVIPADSDGSNPVLTSAKTRILLDKSGVNVPITITGLSAVGCTASFSNNEVSITGVNLAQGSVTANFIGSDGYSGSAQFNFTISMQGADGQPGQPGQNGMTVWLSNEAHAIPANHDGTLPLGALDNAWTDIFAHRNTMLVPVAANAVPGPGQFRYNVESVAGGTTNRVNDSRVRLATMTADTAVITIKVYVESMDNVVTKQMTLSKMRGLDPAIVDRVIDWTFTGTEEFDGSKVRAKSIVAAAIDVINLFAQVVEATNLTVTGNSKIGPFFIGADGIFSSQSGSIINASTLKNSGFNWLYWNQLNYNRTAGLEIGKMGTDGILNIKASSNGGPEFTSGLVIDVGSGRKGFDLKTGDIAVPSGVGMTVKQPIITGYASNNPYSPIIKYLNIDKGIIVSITDN